MNTLDLLFVADNKARSLGFRFDDVIQTHIAVQHIPRKGDFVQLRAKVTQGKTSVAAIIEGRVSSTSWVYAQKDFRAAPEVRVTLEKLCILQTVD